MQAVQGGDFRAFDCSGLGSFWLIENESYAAKKKAKYMYEDTIPIEMDHVQRGDWVFRGTGRSIYHIGYIVDNLQVIHAAGRTAGVICEPFDPMTWDLAGRPKSSLFGE